MKKLADDTGGSDDACMNDTGVPDDANSELVYYYSREHRLKRASPAVKELNDGKKGSGLVQRVAGNRANIFLLVSIMIICLMYAMGSRGRDRDGIELDGNTLSISIEKLKKNSSPGSDETESLSFLMRKTAPKDGSAYTGAVDIAVSPVQKMPPPGEANPPPELLAQRVFFNPEETELYSLPLPFSGDEFIVIIQTENERLVRRLNKKR